MAAERRARARPAMSLRLTETERLGALLPV